MPPSIERLSFRHGESRSGFAQNTVQLHKDRYTFAADFVPGLDVLDIACGVGYGSAILSDAGARRVVGVDLDADAIGEAKELQARDNVTFGQGDYRELCSAESGLSVMCDRVTGGQFDVVVSLETIEHLPDPADFLDTVLTRLVPSGLFIGSVPVTPSMDANPFHLHDFSPRSFRRLLQSHGLVIESHLRQRQSFNPVTIRKSMREEGRNDLRQNLAGYYVQHPEKLYLRIASTLRHGFNNVIDTVVARMR